MIKPDDSFGKMMIHNFETFGAPLKGIRMYPSVDSHKQRYEAAGYKFVKSMDLVKTMHSVISRQDYMKIMRLEMQDDPEELEFVLQHYVLALAGTDQEYVNII